MKLHPALVVLILLTASALTAQEKQYNNNAEARAHFSLEKEFGDHWSVHLDQQYRFGDNISRLTRGSAALGLTYKINKHIKFLGEYKYLQRARRPGMFAERHWFSGSVMLKGDIDHWRFIYRNQLQLRNGDVNSDEQHLTKIYNRHKVSVRYALSRRLTLYHAGEIYIPLNNPKVNGIDRSRHFTGLIINTARHQQLEFYFMFQQEWQKGAKWWDQTDKYPSQYFDRDFVFGVGYGIEL